MIEAVYNFDWKVFEWISAHLWCRFLDVFTAVISITGEGGAIWIAVAVAFLFFKKTRKTGIMMGAALLVMLLINDNILKPLIARPRPWDYGPWQGIFVYPGKAFTEQHSFSFPSGHTSSSVTAAVILLIYNKKIGVPAMCYAFLMGFSRVYLFDHYCTDVLAAFVVGIIYALIGYLITTLVYNLIERKKKAKAEAAETADAAEAKA